MSYVSTTAGSRASRASRSPRASRCRSSAARRCAPAPTRWPTRSRPTRRGRPTRSSSASTTRSGRNTLVDVWRCYELWSLLGELATCRARSSRSASGAAAPARHGGARGGARASTTRSSSATPGRASSRPARSTPTTATASTTTRRARSSRSSSTHSGLSNVELLQGVFPDDTGERIADRTFRLCHVDVDVYQSAKDVFDWVWPRLSPGGVAVFDDYGFPACPGVTQARRRAAHARRPARAPQPQRPWDRRQALSAPQPRRRVRPAPAHAGRPLRRLARAAWRCAATPTSTDARLGDFGCGFDASFARTQLEPCARRCSSTSRWPTT